jgi:hypothetical protein
LEYFNVYVLQEDKEEGDWSDWKIGRAVSMMAR